MEILNRSKTHTMRVDVLHFTAFRHWACSSFSHPIAVWFFSKVLTSCWINHTGKRFLCCHHWPFLFPSVIAGCEDATQRAIKAWSATLSCHVVSAAPFVLINCWEKCVTSCQADCWCPSGHPSVPAARWRYCGSDWPQRRAGPCRMWDNTGKEEEGIPELCAEARSDECLWDRSPVPPLPPPSPEDRLCHPLTFCVWQEWEWRLHFVSLLHRFSFLLPEGDICIRLGSEECTVALYFNHPV